MSDQNDSAARTVSSNERSHDADISSLVLLAVLLAAGFILNMTVGNALAMVGIKPQLTTSIPGLNFATELVAALVMVALVRRPVRVGGRDVTPLVAAFATTLVSGAPFAVAGTLVMGAALGTVVVKVPIVLGTAVFSAIVVQALYMSVSNVAKR